MPFHFQKHLFRVFVGLSWIFRLHSRNTRYITFFIFARIRRALPDVWFSRLHENRNVKSPLASLPLLTLKWKKKSRNFISLCVLTTHQLLKWISAVSTIRIISRFFSPMWMASEQTNPFKEHKIVRQGFISLTLKQRPASSRFSLLGPHFLLLRVSPSTYLTSAKLRGTQHSSITCAGARRKPIHAEENKIILYEYLFNVYALGTVYELIYATHLGSARRQKQHFQGIRLVQ